MADGYRELRGAVFAANLEVVGAGLVVLTFGNASACDRGAGVAAIKPSGVSYAELRPEDIVVLDLASGETIAGDRRPSSDTPTHLELYRRFSTIGGIVHTHSASATAWAQARRPIPCLGTTHADHFRGEIPVTRALTAAEIAGDYERHTGDAIAETIGDGDPLEVPAALVASHGPFAWGASVEEAVTNAVALEAVAAMATETFSLDPEAASADPVLIDRHFARKHGPGAYYGQPR
jgi:L-ribulose-5-phosphate 4-epimerase